MTSTTPTPNAQRGLFHESSDIEIREVTKKFSHVTVIDKLSMSLASGTTTCIIGASGSGKSTLLRCINGLETIDGGDITVGGTSLTHSGTNINEFRSGVGMVFQQFNLFPHLDVLHNVTLALRKVRGLGAEEAEEIARFQLERVGLSRFIGQRPQSLSGGQQQRVAIARSLAMEPKVMLFDEATSALDPELVKGILGIMKELATAGMTMVVVTHEMGFAREAATNVAYLERGRIGEFGTPEQIFGNPTNPSLRRFLSQVL